MFENNFDSNLPLAQQNKSLETDLLELVKQNKFDEIRSLLIAAKKNKKSNEWNFMRENYFRKAIREAILLGNLEMVEMFLNEKVDPNGYAPAIEGGGGLPFIHFAVASGKKEMVQLFIKKGARLYNKYEKRENDTSYGIGAAVEGGYVDILDYLLEKGANACGEFEGLERDTYMGHAAKHKRIPIIESLIRHGAIETIPKSIRYAIRKYAIEGFENLEQLLRYRYDEESRKQLVESELDGLLKNYYKNKLTEFDENKNKLQNRIVQDRSDYDNIVRILLDYAVGIDLPSIQFADLNFLRYLKTVAQINFIGVSIGGRPITRELLIKANIAGADEAIFSLEDIEKIEDPLRRQALQERVQSAIKERGLLIKNNIINLVPLWVAAQVGDLDAVIVRLKAGVDPNEEGVDVYYGKTKPIIEAIRNGHEEIVEKLIKNKLNLKMLDDAINIAQWSYHPALAKKLSETKISYYSAANKIQFWYRRTRDENKTLEMIKEKAPSILAQNILARRNKR